MTSRSMLYFRSKLGVSGCEKHDNSDYTCDPPDLICAMNMFDSLVCGKIIGPTETPPCVNQWTAFWKYSISKSWFFWKNFLAKQSYLFTKLIWEGADSTNRKLSKFCVSMETGYNRTTPICVSVDWVLPADGIFSCFWEWRSLPYPVFFLATGYVTACPLSL